MLKKRCPILVRAGVFYQRKRGQVLTSDADKWIRKYCFGSCPLGERCVYDYAGEIKAEDMKKLKEVQDVLV